MYPDMSLDEALIWQATSANPFSRESLIRRMLALDGDARDIANLFNVPIEYVIALEDKNFSCIKEVRLFASFIGQVLESEDPEQYSFSDYSFIRGVALILGLSPSQLSQLLSRSIEE